jgi:predicted dehydrogenase
MGDIRVAVVGYGYWGPNLVRNLLSLRECALAAVCDKEERRLAAFSSLAPEVRVTRNFNALLEDESIEALVIATPVRTHFTLAARALEAGKHVFVEKPLAASADECEGLIERAAARSLVLMVGHTFLYSPAVRRMKELIDEGAIGEVMHFCARRLNLGLFQRDINVVWDLAPHDISIVLHLLGRQPEMVSCQGRAHLCPGIEDIATLGLAFADGAYADIHVSWIDPRKVRELTVVGSRKMIVYDDMEPLEKLRVYDKSVEVPPHYGTFGEFACAYHYGDVVSPYLRLEEPLRIECEHFLSCIRKGEQPHTAGRDGLAVTRVLEAASRSLSEGGRAVPLAGERTAAGERIQARERTQAERRPA